MKKVISIDFSDFNAYLKTCDISKQFQALPQPGCSFEEAVDIATEFLIGLYDNPKLGPFYPGTDNPLKCEYPAVNFNTFKSIIFEKSAHVYAKGDKKPIECLQSILTFSIIDCLMAQEVFFHLTYYVQYGEKYNDFVQNIMGGFRSFPSENSGLIEISLNEVSVGDSVYIPGHPDYPEKHKKGNARGWNLVCVKNTSVKGPLYWGFGLPKPSSLAEVKATLLEEYNEPSNNPHWVEPEQSHPWKSPNAVHLDHIIRQAYFTKIENGISTEKSLKIINACLSNIKGTDSFGNPFCREQLTANLLPEKLSKNPYLTTLLLEIKWPLNFALIGNNGVGKSTALFVLAQHLLNQKKTVLFIRNEGQFSDRFNQWLDQKLSKHIASKFEFTDDSETLKKDLDIVIEEFTKDSAKVPDIILFDDTYNKFTDELIIHTCARAGIKVVVASNEKVTQIPHKPFRYLIGDKTEQSQRIAAAALPLPAVCPELNLKLKISPKIPVPMVDPKTEVKPHYTLPINAFSQLNTDPTINSFVSGNFKILFCDTFVGIALSSYINALNKGIAIIDASFNKGFSVTYQAFQNQFYKQLSDKDLIFLNLNDIDENSREDLLTKIIDSCIETKTLIVISCDGSSDNIPDLPLRIKERLNKFSRESPLKLDESEETIKIQKVQMPGLQDKYYKEKISSFST